MTTEPRIFTKNYVTDDCDLTPSSGPVFPDRICDHDRDSVWQSDGADDDTAVVTFDVVFKEGETAEDRTYDTIILVNHNLKDVTPYYWDGSAWVSFGDTLGITAGTTVITVPSTTSARFRLVMSTTQTANQEKSIGELIVCAALLTPGHDLESYRVTLAQKAVEIELADGSVHRSVFNTSLNRTSKYRMQGQMKYLSFSELEALRQLKEQGAAFLWQPESVTRPQEIFYVFWIGDMTIQYVSTFKTAGFILDFALREV